MKPYSLLTINLLLLSLVTAAPAPDITYNPTKEAPCSVTWEIQTKGDVTEHYEVAGHCMFLDSVDKLCKGGYRAPGFCLGENDGPVNCCIRRKCGQNQAGICVNNRIPNFPTSSRYFFVDPACPSFWGAPAICYMSTGDNLSLPGEQPVRIGLGRSSPSPIQPEVEQTQPIPNALSFNNNNNNSNPWTVGTTAVDVNNEGVGGGGGIQQQAAGFSLSDQQQPTASVAANGGGAARDGGFPFLDYNQPQISSGANGDARDRIRNPDGSPVDANGAATDTFFFDDTS